ncbi:MAG: Uma2 family endonuclease, partial [Symploca sp. SIO2G7]|nr:Uma2 family endonuclease [Symploca sp. SIO2G7]
IQRDLGLKAELYAAAGLKDYWVLNTVTQQLHIFREPQADGYQRQIILQNQQTVTPLKFSDCVISVAECFGQA